MIRKRKLLIISIIVVITFLFSTNFLLTTLTASQSEVKTIQERILTQLEKLPSVYKIRKPVDSEVFDKFIKHITEEAISDNVDKLWEIANSWVSRNQLIDFASPFMGDILVALKRSKIVKADLDTRGTQLKLLLTLEGHQNVIFKPKWYDRTTVIKGPVYAGKDRHSSEIVAFYLSAILNMPFTLCSVERTISLSHDVIPVATKRLINTSFEIGNRTCIYGKCFYCKKEDAICENENFTLDGAVIFNINTFFKSYKSPWQRTYKKNKKAIWEQEENYCKYVKEKLTRRRLLDLIDVSIFDFLIQNGDRHHYETLYDNIVLLDNGKGFGNPYISHLDILAPLYQCCILRNTTLRKLLNLAGGTLQQRFQSIPDIEHLLTAAHMKALEERLLIVFATIEYCKSGNKEQ